MKVHERADIVRGANGSTLPMFRHSLGGLVDHLDCLSANGVLLDRHTRVEMYSGVDQVFGQLSDRLLIIAPFDIGPGSLATRNPG